MGHRAKAEVRVVPWVVVPELFHEGPSFRIVGIGTDPHHHKLA